MAELPKELADKITNAKTGGGRSLKAIWECKGISVTEKMILLFLGSELNYCQDFENQYRFISLNNIAENIGYSKKCIITNIQSLLQKGYINKQLVTPEEQMKGWSNHYCLTSKIFNEYLLMLIEENTVRSNVIVESPLVNEIHHPSERRSPPLVNVVHHPSERRSPIVPVIDPSFNSAAGKIPKQTAATVETIEQKIKDKDMKILLESVRDLHRTAVRFNIASPYDFKLIQEVFIAPLIEKHGHEPLKSFVKEAMKNSSGMDIRNLERNFEASLRKEEEKRNPVQKVVFKEEPEKTRATVQEFKNLLGGLFGNGPSI